MSERPETAQRLAEQTSGAAGLVDGGCGVVVGKVDDDAVLGLALSQCDHDRGAAGSPLVMATITQTGEELLLPNLSLGRKAAQVGLGRLGVKSIATQSGEPRTVAPHTPNPSWLSSGTPGARLLKTWRSFGHTKRAKHSKRIPCGSVRSNL